MRVLYFLENNWVFGKIFNELIKFLHPDIDGDLYCWTRLCSSEESDFLRDKYDLYFSTPVGCFFLHDTYGWPLEKCYAHAHSEFDLDDALARFPVEYFDSLAGYGAVSFPIQQASLRRSISRPASLLPVGITAANYRRPMSHEIKRLGYFGRMARSDHDQPDLKRGYLAQRVAQEAGLEFYNREHLHFLAADRLYREVDVVMFCSTTEGNPYVAIEAAAAGLPVLGTSVGLFPSIVQAGGGIMLPTEEEAFVAAAVTWLNRFRTEPELYQRLSAAAAEIGRMFDWSVVVPWWREELQRVYDVSILKRKDSHALVHGS